MPRPIRVDHLEELVGPANLESIRALVAGHTDGLRAEPAPGGPHVTAFLTLLFLSLIHI